MSYPKVIRCIAFYKGARVSDSWLEYLINAASRGAITKAGQRFQLIPIDAYCEAKQKQQAISDAEARRLRKQNSECSGGAAAPRIRNTDCIPLTSFLPKNRQQLEHRLSQFSRFGHLFSVRSGPLSVTPVHGTGPGDNGNASCLNCGEFLVGKRKGAKYCSKACKQASYRNRGDE